MPTGLKLQTKNAVPSESPLVTKTSTSILPTISANRVYAKGRFFDNRPIVGIDPQVLKAIKARAAILDKWRELDGPRSPVGLPLDPNFVLTNAPDGCMMDFRGGSMHVMDNNPGVVNIETRRVVVTFEGFGLEQRQEKGDELYGTLDCNVGSTGYRRSFDLAQVELGPDDDNRIYQSPIVLWDGPPADINIVAALVENDSGDREEIRNDIRERVRQIFELGSKLAGGIAPGRESDAVFSSLGSESAAAGSLWDWLITAGGDVIDHILGLGDDPYNPAGLTITAEEMRQIAPEQTYTCWNDPRSIPYTHRRTITGTDDGGDVGQITVLFRVRSVS
jgi:hypothetical protein